MPGFASTAGKSCEHGFPIPEKEQPVSSYRMKSLRLPSLTGWKLKMFAFALRNPFTGPLLKKNLFRQTGLVKFRRTRIDEPPAFHPLMAWGLLPSGHPPEQKSHRLNGDTKRIARGNLPLPTIADYADAYRSGATTPETVARNITAAVISQNRQPRPQNVFIFRDETDLMAQAAESARRIQQGSARSILEGVPVAVKDEIDQQPYSTSAGTRFLGHTPAAEDATVVARLRAAGAMLIGKTNMREIGIDPNSLNDHFGTLRNPYDPSREAGGSSSGSGVAVASGLCPAAIGADGGGSIRVPAAHCGVVGLKPTYGRISEHGALPLCWSVAHLGPIGLSTADVALVYEVIAGPDAKDPLSTFQPDEKPKHWDRPSLDDLVIGIYPQWFEHAEAEVVAACKGMLAQLADRGARLQEIAIEELDEMRVAHGIIILSEITASMANYRTHLAEMGTSTRISLGLGQALSAGDYVHAQRMRMRAARIFQKVFEKVDAIVTPATAVTAPPNP